MADKVKLKDALKTLGDAVSDVSLTLEGLDYSNLPVLLKAFQEIHDAKSTLDDLSEIVDTMYKKLSYERVPNALEANGFDSVKSGGKNFIVSVRVNASIPAELRANGFKWLKDVAKAPALITETVNPKSLSSFVTSYFEANAMWPPEDAIRVHKQKYTSIRKA